MTDETFGRVPRAYRERLQDRKIGIFVRRGVREGLECETVISIDTSHSAFLYRPEELAGYLASLALRNCQEPRTLRGER